MKNAKLKIKNEGEDGKLGNEDCPMFTGGLARFSEGGDIVQSPTSKVQSWGREVGGEAEFEYLRLKTIFWIGDTLKGGHRTGESRTKTGMINQFSNAQSPNYEGMAVGALCRLLPPNRYGCLGSPGKSAVAADLAGAVHDDVGDFQTWARAGAMRFAGRRTKCLKVPKVT